MILFISFLGLLFFLGALGGYLRLVRLEHLNRKRVFNVFLAGLLFLTLMTAANWFGLITQSIAIKITMSLYCMAAGFFVGYGIKLISMRATAGQIEYMYRSFWIDVAPNLISVALIVFGIYRTGILTWNLFTGIGITSGISLIGFGFFGCTVHIVPEFRRHGILLLDQYLSWEKIVTYKWASENVLQVDYFNKSNQLSEFRTYIPPEDQSIIERILNEKMTENEEERKQEMLKKD